MAVAINAPLDIRLNVEAQAKNMVIRVDRSMFYLKVGDTWSTDKNVRPESVLGFGTWELIRTSPFTWGEMKKHTWGELGQDTWGHRKYKKCIYVWLRTA